MIQQKNIGIYENGLPQYFYDTIIVKGSAGNTTTKHKVVNTRLFTKPEKDGMLQNISFPLPDGNKFVATHMCITSNLPLIMTQIEWSKLLNFGVIKPEIDDTVYSEFPLSHFYTPQFSSADEQPQFGKFVQLPKYIEITDKGKFLFDVKVPANEVAAISETNGTQLGAGVVDADDSPIGYIKIWLMGELERSGVKQ